ncbi:hypothetical protein EYZ11_006045 [Aspergillus tanneri]|uniref:Uncharacterized protein n=1 Tax=Aspergillus tanneri TaxID=1220188 RepID=A0A4S3JGV7_9EURO|nr:uncharacterized protein ATNIH1004_004785 [Aspergillus tanneri]KAA8648898.1 hypothetical protein ATNIH1004_004785 [Aspergillus tanneri]THC94480.1 hypothetical protein EYZ11_006045 [Aspergillus tanneri]
MKLLLLAPLLSLVQGKLLLDFNAARGDNPSVLGGVNLEAAKGDKRHGNTPELYIKMDKDPKGVPALHFHRDKGYIRTEYHAMRGKTKKDSTYYIGYNVMLGEVPNGLCIFQFKEFKANNQHDGGANIPLDLEIKKGTLNFAYQAKFGVDMENLWSIKPKANTPMHIGLGINTSEDGWVELYFDGKKQTLKNGKTRMSANTFPGKTEPKFGMYHGEEVAVDSYVYAVQIGTELKDILESAGLGNSTGRL